MQRWPFFFFLHFFTNLKQPTEKPHFTFSSQSDGFTHPIIILFEVGLSLLTFLFP